MLTFLLLMFLAYYLPEFWGNQLNALPVMNLQFVMAFGFFCSFLNVAKTEHIPKIEHINLTNQVVPEVYPPPPTVRLINDTVRIFSSVLAIFRW